MSFSESNSLSAFFQTITFKNWGSFFPDNECFLVKSNEGKQKVIEFCQSTKLVPTKTDQENLPRCDCGKEMFVETDTSEPFGFNYRCSGKKNENQLRKWKKNQSGPMPIVCKKKKSCLLNTWFEHQNLSTEKSIFLMFCWVNELPVTIAAQHCNVTDETACDYYSFCREICEVIISNEIGNKSIGGPGMTVEVDETYLKRRKYNKGRKLVSEEIVMFGITCRETKQILFIQVKNKTRRVLWAQMASYIAHGSKICSDGAIMYRNCDSALGFSEHGVVIHDKEFVNSEDPSIQTQTIESRNRWFKVAVKGHRNDRHLQGYTCKYIYRTNHFRDLEKKQLPPGLKFKFFIEDICRVYPGKGLEGLRLVEIGADPDEMELHVGGLEFNLE